MVRGTCSRPVASDRRRPLRKRRGQVRTRDGKQKPRPASPAPGAVRGRYPTGASARDDQPGMNSERATGMRRSRSHERDGPHVTVAHHDVGAPVVENLSHVLDLIRRSTSIDEGGALRREARVEDATRSLSEPFPVPHSLEGEHGRPALSRSVQRPRGAGVLERLSDPMFRCDVPERPHGNRNLATSSLRFSRASARPAL